MDRDVSCQVPEWAGLLPDHGWKGLELSNRAVSGLAVRLRLVGLLLGSQIGLYPDQSLGEQSYLLTMTGRGWSRVTGLFLDLLSNWSWMACFPRHWQVCFLVGPWANRTAQGMLLGGAGAKYRVVSGSPGVQMVMFPIRSMGLLDCT